MPPRRKQLPEVTPPQADPPETAARRAAQLAAASSDGKPADDEESALAADVMEFLTAVDAFRRQTQKRQLGPAEILEVLGALGYANPRVKTKQLEQALAAYRAQHARLFPSWSEVFQVARGLGLARKA